VSSVRRIPFPREHGAWAMLLAAAALAWAHPWARGWPAAVLTLLFVLAFAIQQPLRQVTAGRPGWRWIALYGALLLAGTVWLVVACDMRFLVPAAAAGMVLTAIDLRLRRTHSHRTFLLRFVGGAGLTLVLPAILAAMHPAYAGYALTLWALTLAYFATRILRVRRARGLDRRALVWTQVALYALLALFVARGWAAPGVVVAFVPGTVSALRAAPGESLRTVGWHEMAHLAWFVSVVTLSYHF
jgi:hypothetical protein